MEEKQTKVKIVQCKVCGKEFNKYSRPRGLYNRATCSDYCQNEYRKQMTEQLNQKREVRKQKAINKLVIMLIICLITGAIGAAVGGYIHNAMGGYGNPSMFILIGFGVGFFAPMFIYMDLA
jgi:hypothetical protein